MQIENFDSEQKQNVQELFVLLNLPKNDTFNINNTDDLLNYLIKTQKFICINKPQNEYEEVNLFDTIIKIFRKSGENLPEYFDEPNICEDETEVEILCMMNEYYQYETDREMMILYNVRDKHVISIVDKQYKEKIRILSSQLGIPLDDLENYSSDFKERVEYLRNL